MNQSCIVCAVAVVMLVAGCHEPPRAAQAASAPLPDDEVQIDTTTGKLAYIHVELPTVRHERAVAVLPSQVVMDEDHTVRVMTPVTGRVISLDVAEGDEVAAGAPLAHILSADLAQAASDEAKARASTVAARAALAREEDLYAHHVAALKDLEQARTDAVQAGVELARARSRLTTLGVDRGSDSTIGSQYVLRAPIGGLIVTRAANPGGEVRSDLGAALFTITSLDEVWLTANVYQRDIAAVHRGATLRFTTDALPGHQFDATVSYVSGALDPQTRTALVRATLRNDGHLLRPLETGTAEVLATVAQPLLTIPARALVTHGNSTIVYVEVAHGRYQRRPVVVGDDDGISAVIIQGLSPSDRVVVDGSLLVEGESTHAAEPMSVP
jgi:cobalt-zinc-cadmium efflux system membrane fusion protein